LFCLFQAITFETRNARKSIKGSKDLDSSLVSSNENLSKILPFSGWALGQVTWTKMAKNLPHLWHHSQKKSKTKNVFFHCRFEDLPSLLRVWTAL